MTTETLLAARHLVRDYAALRAVDDLSLSLARGEVLGLLGPNGAGKTTTLQMICGILAPGSGSVELCGIDLAEDPVAAKRCLGYLPEQPPVHREMRVEEYLGHAARLRGLGGASVAPAVDRAMQRCGLAEVRRRLIGQLSKGFQQRVGIAQAIVHEPALVVLDEPTVGLDPIQQIEIRALVRELGREHGVILSTHILPEVQAACDRVVILNRGVVALDAPLADLAGDAPDRFRLRCGSPPEPALVGQLPGVLGTTVIDASTFSIVVDPARFDPDALLAAALAGRWRLRELTPDVKTLEQRFVELTHGAGEAA